MSTTAENPVQRRLPGQAAAPEGPVDLTMMYVMHHGFRRDLNRFAEAVAATPIDDRETWAALAARWERFFEVLHLHHSGEDAGLWPFLMSRADAAERATLEAMEEEHTVRRSRSGLPPRGTPSPAISPTRRPTRWPSCNGT